MVSLRYHAQDTDDYCGAAVAMMLGEHVEAPYREQSDLYASARSLVQPSGDYELSGISPEGLAALFNSLLSQVGRPERFTARYHASARQAVRRLVASEIATGLPGGILGLYSQHWLAYTGFSSEDWAGGRITHLQLHDPAAEPPEPAIPRHSGDDVCGADLGHGEYHQFESKPWIGLIQPVKKGFPSVAAEPTGRVAIPELADEAPPLRAQGQLPSFVRAGFAGLELGDEEPLEDGGPGVRLRPIRDATGGRVGWLAIHPDGSSSVGLSSRPAPAVADQMLIGPARARAGRPAGNGSLTGGYVWRREARGARFVPYRRVRFSAPDLDVFVRADGRRTLLPGE